MYAHSSAVLDGYTVVVAPPADRMPRSHSSHSTRVFASRPTRSSRWTPSESSPAAIARTRSPACRHVIDRHSSPTGYRYASRSGVSCTRDASSWAIEVDLRVNFSGAVDSGMTHGLCPPVSYTHLRAHETDS